MPPPLQGGRRRWLPGELGELAPARSPGVSAPSTRAGAASSLQPCRCGKTRTGIHCCSPWCARKRKGGTCPGSGLQSLWWGAPGSPTWAAPARSPRDARPAGRGLPPLPMWLLTGGLRRALAILEEGPQGLGGPQWRHSESTLEPLSRRRAPVTLRGASRRGRCVRPRPSQWRGSGWLQPPPAKRRPRFRRSCPERCSESGTRLRRCLPEPGGSGHEHR